MTFVNELKLLEYNTAMTPYERKAIELKYEGHTYRQISQAIGGKLSEGSLKNLFMVDGRLYLPYLQFEAERNKMMEQEARQAFKKDLNFAAKIMRTILQQALKRKDFKLALETIKEQMDRAGFVVTRKTEIETTNKGKRIENYEQFCAELQAMGIDPTTGLRTRKAEVEPDKILRS